MNLIPPRLNTDIHSGGQGAFSYDTDEWLKFGLERTKGCGSLRRTAGVHERVPSIPVPRFKPQPQSCLCGVYTKLYVCHLHSFQCI